MDTESNNKNFGRSNKAGLFVSPNVTIANKMIEGKSVFFAIGKNDDLIQKHHLRGFFYELEELEIIRSHFPQAGVFLDIGANIGNHTLFALIMLGASKAIVIEPNKIAYDLLITNIVLNRLEEKCDFSGVGLGLSDTETENMGISFKPRNLGGARLFEGKGDISTITGDTLIKDQTVDFIKIDVEGMEIAVLGGLTKTIAKFRPPIFIEVDNINDAQFKIWLGQHEYKIVDTYRRYENNCNYLIRSIN